MSYQRTQKSQKARIRLELEIGENDSHAMESIYASGVKVISGPKDNSETLSLLTSELQSKKRVIVELAVNDLNVMQNLISTFDNEVKVIIDSDATRRAFSSSLGNDSYDMCKLLLECGAVDVNAKDTNGMTPLLHAAKDRVFELCQGLIVAGSDVNHKTSNGWTALMIAALNDHEKIVRILIEAGCDVNQKHDVGRTALMWSAYNGNAQIIRILLENGADFTVKSSNGETAVDWARESKDEETIELLEYVRRLHRTTLFIQSIEYLRKHRQEYEEEQVRECIPDHVMNGFFRNTIWKSKLDRT